MHQENACITWIYCDYRDEAQQHTPEKLIGGLLKQVLRLNSAALEPIIEKLQTMKSGILSLDSACQLLAEAIAKFDKIYICVDALDECQEHNRAQFLRSLKDLMNAPGSRDSLRLFFTSRPHVGQHVGIHFASQELYFMTLEATVDVIVKYIEYQILLDENGPQMSPEFSKDIVGDILATSDGMLVIPISMNIFDTISDA
jgi:hypothetical protein